LSRNLARIFCEPTKWEISSAQGLAAAWHNKRLGLSNLQRYWDEFGRTDPLWAILTAPGTENKRWDVGRFFASGREEIGALMDYLDGVASGLPRASALDFGCGVGRLTQPLGRYFERAVGVDIAPSMIERARQFASGSSCEFVLLDTGDLRAFPDGQFDLVYSKITLQHMRPRYSTGYLREFIRVLRPGGIVVFQLPSRRSSWRSKVGYFVQALKRAGGGPVMEMYAVPKSRVCRVLEQAGGELVDIHRDGSAGVHFESFRYCARKR
jgi:SAM-dependent methyltransferase